MGHVARTIPIIKQLLHQENQVFIACGELEKKIYSSYFDVQHQSYSNFYFIDFEGYPFCFSGNGSFYFDILKRLRILSEFLKKEKQEVYKIANENNIDFIISDHRYGFRNNKIESIFITHQLQLPLKFWAKPIQYFHKLQIQKFNSIWVLDDEKSTLAGKLSASKGFTNVSYIGPKSRFSFYPFPQKDLDQVIILSGPKVYAEKLYKKLFQENKIKTKAVILSNYPITSLDQNHVIYSGENWKFKDELILRAKTIISHSGYSTIMDLNSLKCQFEILPTEGQQEQEYLYKLHSHKIRF